MFLHLNKCTNTSPEPKDFRDDEPRESGLKDKDHEGQLRMSNDSSNLVL